MCNPDGHSVWFFVHLMHCVLDTLFIGCMENQNDARNGRKLVLCTYGLMLTSQESCCELSRTKGEKSAKKCRASGPRVACGAAHEHGPRTASVCRYRPDWLLTGRRFFNFLTSSFSFPRAQQSRNSPAKGGSCTGHRPHASSASNMCMCSSVLCTMSLPHKAVHVTVVQSTDVTDAQKHLRPWT